MVLLPKGEKYKDSGIRLNGKQRGEWGVYCFSRFPMGISTRGIGTEAIGRGRKQCCREEKVILPRKVPVGGWSVFGCEWETNGGKRSGDRGKKWVLRPVYKGVLTWLRKRRKKPAERAIRATGGESHSRPNLKKRLGGKPPRGLES